LHISLFQKALDALFGFLAAAFADNSQRAARFVLWDQPVEIRPYRPEQTTPAWYRAGNLWEASRWLVPAEQFDRRPTCGAAHAGSGSVGAYNLIRMQLFSLTCGLDFQAQSARIWAQAEKVRVKRNFCAGFCRFIGQRRNQARAFNNQSGRLSATSAERPSVNNSKRRISLTMLDAATSCSCSRKWWLQSASVALDPIPILHRARERRDLPRHFCSGEQARS